MDRKDCKHVPVLRITQLPEINPYGKAGETVGNGDRGRRGRGDWGGQSDPGCQGCRGPDDTVIGADGGGEISGCGIDDGGIDDGGVIGGRGGPGGRGGRGVDGAVAIVVAVTSDGGVIRG